MASLCLFRPVTARAQLIDRYFQSNIPAFDQQRGLAELEEPHPASAPSVHLEGLALLADLNESFGYDSNVDGVTDGPGSPLLETSPSLSVLASGPRGRFGVDLTLDDERYFDLPRQNRTNWTAVLGGTYALGRDALVLGYAHLDEHEVASELGSTASAQAIPYNSDDFRALYGLHLGRIVLTPNIEFTTFRYGETGLPLSENVQDRNILTSGVTGAYPIGIDRNIVLAVQDVETDYLRNPLGEPSLSSNSVLALTGIDYRSSGVWRYRLLVGFENRNFRASAYKPITTPIAAASVIWTPTGLTTVTATLSREIEDAGTSGAGSYTYTDVRTVVDHQLRHNFLLQANVDLQFAEYQAGGTQRSVGVGASATWLLGPRLQLSLSYSFRDQGAVEGELAVPAVGLSNPVTGDFAQNLTLLTLRVSL